EVYLELFLVESIIKSGSSERTKLPGSDSRINCDSSFCGKRLCGLVETSGSSFFLLCLSLVLSS
ncbi:unnamed protein product, partial [Brassica rapa]